MQEIEDHLLRLTIGMAIRPETRHLQNRTTQDCFTKPSLPSIFSTSEELFRRVFHGVTVLEHTKIDEKGVNLEEITTPHFSAVNCCVARRHFITFAQQMYRVVDRQIGSKGVNLASEGGVTGRIRKAYV